MPQAGGAVPNLAGSNANVAAQMAIGLAALLPPQAPQATQQNMGGRLPSSAVTNNPSMLTFSTPSIIALVNGREKAREKHDWEAADAIRADLRSHGVDVWDKEKVW